MELLNATLVTEKLREQVVAAMLASKGVDDEEDEDTVDLTPEQIPVDRADEAELCDESAVSVCDRYEYVETNHFTLY